MQLMRGNIQATTGVKGIGDLFGKALKGAVTKESAVKPEYVEDGMFLACDARVKRNVIARKNISSAVLGGEGLVNVYRGTGRVLMSPVAPTSSLYESTNTISAKAAAKSSNTLGQ